MTLASALLRCGRLIEATDFRLLTQHGFEQAELHDRTSGEVHHTYLREGPMALRRCILLFRSLSPRFGSAATAAIAVLVLLVSGVASAPSASAVTVTQHPGVARGVLSLINQERWAHRLPAVSMDTKLNSSAYNHNIAMATHNIMSHQCSGEQSLGDRVDAVHYDWSTAGENIGWNSEMTTSGANALELVMYQETPPNDGHRLIILSTAYRNVGISVITDATHHKLWLTEDFGHLM